METDAPKVLTPEERQRLLDRSMTRPAFPLVRRITPGLVSLGRQLGLNVFQPKEAKRTLTPAEQAAQGVALTWLLDRRNSLDLIREVAAQGFAYFEAQYLDPAEERDYRFSIAPTLQAYAQKETQWTIEELAAADYAILPKPAVEGEQAPPGNS